MHVVVAAAPAVDPEAAAFQIREGPAEIAAAPIGLLGDFGGNFLCEVRIISKDNNARALVQSGSRPSSFAAVASLGWMFTAHATESARKSCGGRASTNTAVPSRLKI